MRNKAMLLLIVVLISAGAGCILYPDMVYLLASQKQGQVIQDYQMSTEVMNQQRMDEEYQKAINYNEKLINPIIGDPFSEDAQDNAMDYAEILNVDGVMGTLEIPKIKMNLPIYHGTSESVLSKGAGHLKNTSLPVGGTGTHAVLTDYRRSSNAADRRCKTIPDKRIDPFFYNPGSSGCVDLVCKNKEEEKVKWKHGFKCCFNI